MRRLCEDPQLSAAVREDLLRSRAAGEDYPAADKLPQLRAALADAARQPLSASYLGNTLWKGAWRAAHPGWKVFVLALVAGTGSFVGYRVLDQASARSSADSLPVTPPPAAVDVDVAVSLEPAPATSLPPEPAPPAAPSAPAAKLTPSAAKLPSLSSSRREIAQLVRIRALLERDPAAAYRLALRSEREFPSGLLSEERQALSIIALAKTGAKDAAARNASEFLARHPQSPMRELVRAAVQP
jgi:hypothetical protein